MASLVSGISVSNGTVVTPAILNANPTLTAGTIVDADISASAAIVGSKFADNSVTASKLGTNEQKQLCKAWVNFDGTVGAPSNTAIPSGQTLTASAGGSTLTWSGTGFTGFVGMRFVFIINGSSILGGLDLWYNPAIVTSLTSTQIVFTLPTGVTFASAVNHTANGSNSYYRLLPTIRSSYNVSSITRNGTGDYIVNFATAMADANYAPSFSTVGNSLTDMGRFAAVAGTIAGGANLKTTTQLRIQTGAGSTGGLFDVPEISCTIFGN